ncbi:MAG: type II toxin-antitoxin system YoeB family toxin [Bacteroidaceae bacterium]|nr:type II toxin-antitoxin system YoeB family toxin [Bacteroidaceae bacterium]
MKGVDKVLKKWRKSNPQLFAKYEEIVLELQAHPCTGLGHPKPLVGGNDITYSRHITAHDRIIYNIYDDMVMVLVIQVEDHYNDK